MERRVARSMQMISRKIANGVTGGAERKADVSEKNAFICFQKDKKI